MFAKTLNNLTLPDRQLTISASDIGNDVQITMNDLFNEITVIVKVKRNDINSGIGSIKTVNDNVIISSRRVTMNTATGLEFSWLLDDWEHGEEAMTELIAWLRSKSTEPVEA